MVHPQDKVLVTQMGGVRMPGNQTNAEVHLSGLSAEVLRDLARNEAASKEWRKAAVELLIKKQHVFANHSDLRELKMEIQAEEEARVEVEALAHQYQENVKAVWQTTDPDAVIPPHCGVNKEVVSPVSGETVGLPEEVDFLDLSDQ